jgi:hypothetical protein
MHGNAKKGFDELFLIQKVLIFLQMDEKFVKKM